MPKLYFRESNKFICPYIKMDISKNVNDEIFKDIKAICKIIIGPKSLITIKDVESIIINNDYSLKNIEITKSSIPYR